MHKKAFTLTELLVVVVIIGVLSAVVLPKFSKMLETFKTGEAEELMAAVRNEQEARCALDKDYAIDSRKLTSIAKLQLGSIATETVSTTYYDYKLGNVGMSATRLQVGSTDQYTLKIPSYADGRICCEGLGCDKLSKDYPACNTLVNQTDFVQASASCAVGTIGAGANPETHTCTVPAQTTETRQCGCTSSGTKSRTFNSTICDWGDWSPCTESEANCCTVPAQTTETRQCGCTSSGTKSRTFNSTTCQWGPWGECTETEDCPAVCSWEKKELISCSLDWEMYCEFLEGSRDWVPFLRNSGGCNIGTYYASSGTCKETPSSPDDICIAYEGHIFPPDCVKDVNYSPHDRVNWGVARKYVAKCRDVVLPR